MTCQVDISLKSPDSISCLGRMCSLVIKETDYKTRTWFLLNFACSSKQILQFLYSLVLPSVKWEWQYSFISQGWALIIVCRTPVEIDVNSFFCCSQCRFCNAQFIAKGWTYCSWSCNRRKLFSSILKVLSSLLIDASTTLLSHQSNLWIYTTRKKIELLIT